MSSNRNTTIDEKQRELINQFLFQHFPAVFSLFSLKPFEVIKYLIDLSNLSSDSEIFIHLNDLGKFLLQCSNKIPNKKNSHFHISHVLEESNTSPMQPITTEKTVNHFKKILEQDLAQIIKSYKKEIDTDTYYTLLLLTISLNDDANLFNWLLENLNENELHKIFPLILTAAKKGRAKIVESLIEHGVNTNIANQGHMTPLLIAAKSGHTEVVKVLLKNKANKESKDKFGWTALHFAALNGDTETAQCLLEHGANVNVETNEGVTALYLAARHGQAETASVLIKHEADISPLCEDAQIPYIQFMQALGYPINSKGLCHGLGHMAKQAILLDDISPFNRRLFSVRKTYFDAKAETPTKKRFFNWLYNRRVKKKIKEKFEALRNQELKDKVSSETKIDHFAFSDGVYIYQSLNSSTPIQSEDEKHFLLVNPLNLEEKHPIIIDSFTGNYTNEEEIKAYFNCLGKGIEKVELTSPIAFILSTPWHTMTIGYNRSRKTWLFFDANSALIRETESIEIMANEIERGFGYPAIFSTTVNILSKDVKNWERCMQGLKKGNEDWEQQWKTLHTVSFEKINMQNKHFGRWHSHTWKSVAVSYGDPDTVKAIRDKQSFLKTNRGTIMGCAWGGAVAGFIVASTTYAPSLLIAPFLIPFIPIIVAGGLAVGAVIGAIVGIGIAALFTNRREISVARRNQIIIKRQLKTEKKPCNKKNKYSEVRENDTVFQKLLEDKEEGKGKEKVFDDESEESCGEDSNPSKSTRSFLGKNEGNTETNERVGSTSMNIPYRST